MNDHTENTIETAIQNLKARRPKPRGRREALTQYLPQLRELLAAGWSRSEIIAEIKAVGGRISPALLRDVLQIDSSESRKPNAPRQTRTRLPTSLPASAAIRHSPEQENAPVEPGRLAHIPYDFDQPDTDFVRPNNGQPTYDFEPE